MAEPSADTIERYKGLLYNLMPDGPLWRRPMGPGMDALLQSWATELARVNDRAVDLLHESDPFETRELLPEWEALVGLPDVCTGQLPTEPMRRAALVARLAQSGGQSALFYIGLAALLGFTIDIEEHRAPLCGQAECGDELSTEGPGWVHAWTVHAPRFTPVFFRTGRSSCGDPLVSWSPALLECTLGRLKPAHTVVRFQYDRTFQGYAPWGLQIESQPVSLKLLATLGTITL